MRPILAPINDQRQALLTERLRKLARSRVISKADFGRQNMGITSAGARLGFKF